MKNKTNITKQNKKFEQATPAQKRVMIAEEVIAQVKANRIISDRGVWLNIDFKDGGNINPTESIQNLFKNNQVKECRCCALGAMMVSCTILNNKELYQDLCFHFEHLGHWVDEYKEKLPNGFNKFFTRKQLIMIECAFEGFMSYFRSEDLINPLTHNEIKKTKDFFEEHPETEERLLAIMENIIKNKGTFKL